MPKFQSKNKRPRPFDGLHAKKAKQHRIISSLFERKELRTIREKMVSEAKETE